MFLTPREQRKISCSLLSPEVALPQSSPESNFLERLLEDQEREEAELWR